MQATLPRPSATLQGARLRAALLTLLALTAVVYAVEITAVHSASFAEHPRVIAGAVAFDLTVFVPFLYWALVVRRKLARASTMVGIFLASLIGARLVLPVDQAGMLAWERLLAAPAELGIIGYVVVKVRRTTRAMRGSPTTLDVPERIALALRDAFPNPMVERALSTELTLLYYAFASWTRAPHVPPGATPFTYHRKNGIVGLLSAMLGAAAVELFVAHLLVHTHGPRAAWALTAFSGLGMVWLLGFIRAIVLRPVLVGADGVVVRGGVQWQLEVPQESIERIETGRTVKAPSKRAVGHLQGTPVAQPNVLITLRTPLEARGLYGRRKTVRTVGLSLDDAVAFAKMLSPSALPGHPRRRQRNARRRPLARPPRNRHGATDRWGRAPIRRRRPPIRRSRSPPV